MAGQRLVPTEYRPVLCTFIIRFMNGESAQGAVKVAEFLLFNEPALLKNILNPLIAIGD